MLTRAGNIASSAAGSGLAPTTMQTSITHGLATYSFDKPVRVGTYVDGQPFAVSDQAFNIIQVTPDSASVVASDFVQNGSTISGQPYVKNGLMIDPWLAGDGTQGFDGLLSVYADKRPATSARSPSRR